jgi:hypothetical protein
MDAMRRNASPLRRVASPPDGPHTAHRQRLLRTIHRLLHGKSGRLFWMVPSRDVKEVPMRQVVERAAVIRARVHELELL